MELIIGKLCSGFLSCLEAMGGIDDFKPHNLKGDVLQPNSPGGHPKTSLALHCIWELLSGSLSCPDRFEMISSPKYAGYACYGEVVNSRI